MIGSFWKVYMKLKSAPRQKLQIYRNEISSLLEWTRRGGLLLQNAVQLEENDRRGESEIFSRCERKSSMTNTKRPGSRDIMKMIWIINSDKNIVAQSIYVRSNKHYYITCFNVNMELESWVDVLLWKSATLSEVCVARTHTLCALLGHTLVLRSFIKGDFENERMGGQTYG